MGDHDSVGMGNHDPVGMGDQIQLVNEKLKKERPEVRTRDVPGDWFKESNRQASELVL